MESLFESLTSSITTIEKKIVLLVSVPPMLGILHILYPLFLYSLIDNQQNNPQEMARYILYTNITISLIGSFATLYVFRHLVKSKNYRIVGTIIIFLLPTISMVFAIINYLAKL